MHLVTVGGRACTRPSNGMFSWGRSILARMSSSSVPCRSGASPPPCGDRRSILARMSSSSVPCRSGASPPPCGDRQRWRFLSGGMGPTLQRRPRSLQERIHEVYVLGADGSWQVETISDSPQWVTYQSEVKKSVFIAYSCSLASVDKLTMKLDKVKDLQPGMGHYCWASVYGTTLRRCSDDGEPSGTAGRPILTAIDNSGLDRLLVVVARKFGGTKLGRGKLAREYLHVASECLSSAERCVNGTVVSLYVAVPPQKVGGLYSIASKEGEGVVSCTMLDPLDNQSALDVILDALSAESILRFEMDGFVAQGSLHADSLLLRLLEEWSHMSLTAQVSGLRELVQLVNRIEGVGGGSSLILIEDGTVNVRLSQ